YDHVVPFREGGRTSAENIQGLCEACNQAKEAPGWNTRTSICRMMCRMACTTARPPIEHIRRNEAIPAGTQSSPLRPRAMSTDPPRLLHQQYES
ncbi:HNH endonuclease, partial [Arthrobacter sp. UYP6]|uniref:HNH endonuclease n=1 Tax=Arthrobacter sp. UYP6 TaxID=1756378 RepID=UPI0033998CC7